MLLYTNNMQQPQPQHGAFTPDLPFMALLFMCLFLLANTSVAAPQVADAHHLPQERACLTCHQALDAQLHNTALTPGSGCVSCHTAGRLPQDQPTPHTIAASMPIMLASAAEAENPTKSGLPRSLSLPLYYDVTRMGASPNPMLRIPAGKFIMGTDARLSDEGPQHSVHLPTYWIDKYEVTNLQYQQFIEAVGKRAPEHFANRTFPTGKADHPVTFVSWHDANAYCTWADKRLPTDQEWEKAARGTDGRMFPWGQQFDIHQANTPARWERLKEKGDTTPVGAFPGGASPYGALDMSGNVWEWTASWYRAYPGNKKISENYGDIYKTLKGGSWWDCSFYKCGISAPVFNRAFFNAKVKNASFGFRCAKDDK